MSEGDGGTYQPVDQRAIDAMRYTPGLPGMMGTALNAVTRAADNAALAAAQQAGGSMAIDLDQVNKLAQFFEDEAQALQDRADSVRDLSNIEPAGSDPVSTQVTPVYEQVASGSGSGYLENYLKLADYFALTAKTLRKNVEQWQTDQQNAADSLGGGNLA